MRYFFHPFEGKEEEIDRPSWNDIVLMNRYGTVIAVEPSAKNE
jgi:hypothetical protein